MVILELIIAMMHHRSCDHENASSLYYEIPRKSRFIFIQFQIRELLLGLHMVQIYAEESRGSLGSLV